MAGICAMMGKPDAGAGQQAAAAGGIPPASRTLLVARRWAEAAEQLQAECSAGNGSHAVLASLGKALLKAGRPDEALPHLAAALALQPADDKTLRRIQAIAEARHPMPRPAAAKPVRDGIGDVLALARDHGFTPGTVFDIGVCTGTPGLYGVFPDALHVLVDPVEESRPILEHICRGLRRAVYRLAAAGAEPGTGTLLIPGFPSGSRLIESVGDGKRGEHRAVPVVTLDQLAREVSAPGPFVIKADTEGSELDVLRGAAGTLRDTEMIIMESRLRPSGKAPQFHEIVDFLYARGFVAYDIITLNYHGSDRTLLQVDLVAVKEEGFFRSRDGYRKPAFASAAAASGKELNAVKKRRKFERALLEAAARR